MREEKVQHQGAFSIRRNFHRLMLKKVSIFLKNNLKGAEEGYVIFSLVVENITSLNGHKTQKKHYLHLQSNY